MNGKAILNAVKVFAAKNSTGILTGLAVGGVVLSAVMTGEACVKASKTLEQQKYESEEAPTKTEQAKAVAGYFVGPAIMAGTTIACIIGTNHIHMRRYAALASAYAFTTSDIKEYKEKVEEKLGKKKTMDIASEMAKERIDANPPEPHKIVNAGGETLCYDSMSGRYFMSDAETLRQAQNTINHELNQQLMMSLNDFYHEIGLEEIRLGNELGWTAGDQMDISFSSQLTSKNEPCLVIDYFVGPRFDYGEVH